MTPDLFITDVYAPPRLQDYKYGWRVHQAAGGTLSLAGYVNALTALTELELDLTEWRDEHPDEPLAAFPLWESLLALERTLCLIPTDTM